MEHITSSIRETGVIHSSLKRKNVFTATVTQTCIIKSLFKEVFPEGFGFLLLEDGNYILTEDGSKLSLQ
jgi:hypothetical protein